MTELTTAQSVKQSVRQFGLRASDTWKLAGAKTSRSDTKVLDVALVKATTPQTRVPPKEKHVRTLKLAVSGGAAHKETGYVLTHLLERLRGAADWLTALKTLITIHRLLAESGEGLWDELLRVAGAPQGHSSGVLGMDNFIDTTNIEGRFDFSEFCRAYGKYLDEQLGLWSSIHWTCSLREGGGAAFGGDGNGHHGHAYDDHFHGAPAAAPRSPTAGGGAERFRTLPAAELLVQLPRLQRLQRRLVDCVPRGAATHDSVVMAALDAVVRESFRLYKAVSEGVINLADAYFTLPYLDAVKGLEIYREASESTQALSAFYGAVGQLGVGAHAGATLPSLTPPPADFVVNMEEYLADAPRPEGAGLPAKKAAPLRKGRLATPGAPRPGDPAGQAPLRTLSSDPGMVLAPPRPGEGGEGAGAQIAAPPGSASGPAAAGGGAGVPSLLGSTPVTPARPATAPSPLDLLGDLTLDGLDLAPATQHPPPAQQAPASSNPFAGPDPFLGAAAGPVAPGPVPPPQQPLDPFALPAAAAAPAVTYDPFLPGHAPAPRPQQQQQQQQQPWAATHAPPPSLDTSFFFDVGGGTVAAASPAPTWTPAATMRGGTQVATPPSAGGEDLVKVAGARDPFATLAGLSPASVGKAPSPGAGFL